MKYSALSAALFAPSPTRESVRTRPGRVAALHGLIIQSDAVNPIGRFFIRPVEALDLICAGVSDVGRLLGFSGREETPGLGMHAGLHVRLEDGREFVAEQLCGGWREWFVNGLHWTPLESFRKRGNPAAGGWDVTVPMDCFRQVDPAGEEYALAQLNQVRGIGFIHEDCTAFIARVFGPNHRLFADSPIMSAIGVYMRSGEPALLLVKRNAQLPARSAALLRVDALRQLPDPIAANDSMSLRQLHFRCILICMACVALAGVVGMLRVPARWTRRGSF
jgi:hypothetical protein